MDSLLRDVKFAMDSSDRPGNIPLITEHYPSKSTSQANQRTSSSTNHSIESIEGHDKPMPSLSSEDMEKMMAFLSELESLRSSDPKAYAETIASLGLPMPPEHDTSSSSHASAATPASAGLGDDPLAVLYQSMRDFQGKAQDIDEVKVTLPDGKTILGKEGVENKMKGKWIEPEAGFAFKAKLVAKLDGYDSVYINLCIHDDIDIPAVKKRLNDNGESVEGLNIPMSVGPRYEVIDDDGVTVEDGSSSAMAIAFDVIVNSMVMKEANEDATGKYRDFMCQLCIQYIEAKLNSSSSASSSQVAIAVDKRYTLLKVLFKRKDGSSASSTSPAAQYIQDRKNMPKIEILEEKTTTSKSPFTSKKQQGNIMPLVEVNMMYQLLWIYNDGDASESAVDMNVQDYLDPIISPPHDSLSMLLRAEIIASSLTVADVLIQASPYRIEVKTAGYKLTKVNFPCAVDVPAIRYEVHRYEGYTQRFLLEIRLPIDKHAWTIGPDPGSKPWLIAQALADDVTGDDNRMNIYSTSIPSSSSATSMSSANIIPSNDEYAEDKFHIRLPADVDPYTGIKLDEKKNELLDDAFEFPEDRFHRQDAASSFIINQRDQAIKDKAMKREQEKAERVDDPNVEYVDVDDYKPGGKYGPAAMKITPAVEVLSEDRIELKKASEVVASSLASLMDSQPLSAVWTELLD